MLSYKDINIGHLHKLMQENGEECGLIGDLGITDKAWERMTMYVGAMLMGRRVVVADVEYGMMEVEGEGPQFFRTEPGQPNVCNRIESSIMATEWAYCWYDAAPPTLKELDA
jgi:hypothetical protein